MNMDMISVELQSKYRGKNLRILRNVSALKLSQKLRYSDSCELSVTEHVVTAYENGEFESFQIEHLIQIAQYFNTSLSFLCGLDDIKAPFLTVNFETCDLQDFSVYSLKNRVPELIKEFHVHKCPAEIPGKLFTEYRNIKARFITINDIVPFSLYFNVSVDYILGLSEYRSSFDFYNTTREAYTFKNNLQPINFKDTFYQKAENKESFQERLSRLMDENCYTSADIHRLLNYENDIAISTVRSWTIDDWNVYPVFGHVLRLSKWLGVSMDYLTCRSDTNVPNLTYRCSSCLDSIRHDSGVSKREFCTRTRLAVSVYNKLSNADEKNIDTYKNIRTQTVMKACDFFDVSIDYLFGLTPYKNEETFLAMRDPTSWLKKGTMCFIKDSEDVIVSAICIGHFNTRPVIVTENDERVTVTDNFCRDKNFFKIY